MPDEDHVEAEAAKMPPKIRELAEEDPRPRRCRRRSVNVSKKIRGREDAAEDHKCTIT